MYCNSPGYCTYPCGFAEHSLGRHTVLEGSNQPFLPASPMANHFKKKNIHGIRNRQNVFTARQYTVCSLVYCTSTNRYSSALDTWAVFHTTRMRRLYTSQNEHFASTYDIAVCIWIRLIRHHLSAYSQMNACRLCTRHVFESFQIHFLFCILEG